MLLALRSDISNKYRITAYPEEFKTSFKDGDDNLSLEITHFVKYYINYFATNLREE